jgi:hypothetical protein
LHQIGTLKEALKSKPFSRRHHAALPAAHKVSAPDGSESA